ncbi:UNVERIFIED_CONTAM: hypothetical protein FKN15_042185 [Acipenser sinensis]
MGRKSCREQQQRHLQHQQQQHKKWWSRVPTLLGPPDWAAEQKRWRAEGAPLCGACGEFGHDREDCPYGNPLYKEAWNQGLVGDAAEWFWAVDQTRPSTVPKRGEAEHVAQEGEAQLSPTTKGEPHQSQGIGECLPLPPPPPGEEPLPPLLPKGEEPLKRELPVTKKGGG